MSIMPCSVVDCTNPRRYVKTGWCNAHYVRWQKNGDVQADVPLNAYRMRDRPDGTRMCRRCDEWKTLESFAKNSRCVLGRLGICKPCQVEDYRKRYEGNEARLVEIRKSTYANHRDKRIAESTVSVHRRRALLAERSVDEGITVEALRKRDGDNCCYCGLEMEFFSAKRGAISPLRASLEHVLPLSRGGDHSWANTALACHKCNMQKNKKTVDEWVRAA